jgi:hypothetical protein
MLDILKRFFRSRVERQSPPSKSEPSLPLGLNRDQLEQIQAFTEMVPYKHYVTVLGRLYEHNLAAILRGLPHEAYMFQCGVCFALEQIAKLPDDLTLKLRELDARHSANTDSVPDASAIFTNSPFWEAYQRLGARARQYGGAGVSLPGRPGSAPVPPGENGG